MKVVLLPGNSKENKAWIEEIEKTLKKECATKVIYYEHWKTGEETINIEAEVKKLEQVVVKEGVIFAKSAGCLVVLKGIAEKRINPKKCIFAGVSVRWAESKNIPIKEWLKKNKIPTVILQKTEDPAIHVSELRILLQELKVENYTMKEIPGNDHHYENIKQIKELILKGA
ncbi:MAG: hypothetical protein Q8L34_03235 [Candidatus Woesearchaeota archaeon]|nr:hypothetical protein [Candidatus Woesearchaeota archaeon]